ncbi:MAG: DNA translocase FtsK 4TM domain-containing protein [Patescibacteria group bacterium]|nr:DNA translocase FtsK 4TM domain-containing protein [Patescibacteria group bacterium]
MSPRKKRGRPRGSKNKKLKREFSLGKINLDLSPQMQKEILIVFLFAVSAIALLSFFNLAGYAGEFIDNALRAVFGFDRLILPITLLIIAFSLLYPERVGLKLKNYLGFVVLILSLNGLIHLLVAKDTLFENIEQGGGYAGMALATPLLSYLGFAAAVIILSSLLIVSVILSFNTTLRAVFGPVKLIAVLLKNLLSSLRGAKLQKEQSEFPNTNPDLEYGGGENTGFRLMGLGRKKQETDEEETTAPLTLSKSSSRKKVDIPFNLLSNTTTKPSAGDIRMNSERIRKTLENFGIPAEMGAISVGPTVAQYTLKPAEGINLARITSLSNNLAMSLAAHPIRIEAPIPGKSLVGIEVPNRSIAMVRLREILESQEFKQKKSNLTIALGKDVAGKTWSADLAKMPHLLVAGSTGSGKTVSLISIIISLLYQNSPDDLKFIMIDPKRVELPLFNGVPHLLTPVITHIPKIVNSLKWALLEMDRRFDILQKYGKRDIATFNRETNEKMPYLVIVIDELAELMKAASSEVETCIIRLAQMARAVGIHLIIATQRPSVDVITGLIKANITSRIAFAVGSMVDSRTILDTSGAEKLLGRGDMLYISSEVSKPKRLQSAYVADNEIKRVVDFLKQKDSPDYMDEVTEKQIGSSIVMGGQDSGYSNEGDALLPDARDVIRQAKKASASLLQRRLKVGYARAARLLDILEEQGFIGPADGAKPRELLITDEQEEKHEELIEVEGDEEEDEEDYEDGDEDENVKDEDEEDEES